MRRVILNKDEQFSNKHLKRTGAFNAKAMAAATSIIEQVREQGDAALRELTASSTASKSTTSACRPRPSPLRQIRSMPLPRPHS